MDPLLQLEIQREPEILAGNARAERRPSEVPDDPAEGIHLHEPHPCFPLQDRIVLALDAGPTDDHALLVVLGREGRVGQFFRRDLADVSEDMRNGRTVDIAALRTHLHIDVGKLCAPLHHRRGGLEACVQGYHERLARVEPEPRLQSRDLQIGERKIGAKLRHGPDDGVVGGRQDRDRVAGNVIGNDEAVTVVDRAAGSGHVQPTQPVLVSPELVRAGRQDLHAEESGSQGTE